MRDFLEGSVDRRVFLFFISFFKFRARQPERRHVDSALATLLPRE